MSFGVLEVYRNRGTVPKGPREQQKGFSPHSVSVRCALVKMTPLGSDPVSRDSSDLLDRKKEEQKRKLGDV